MLEPTYKATRCHKPEDHKVNVHRCENLEPYSKVNHHSLDAWINRYVNFGARWKCEVMLAFPLGRVARIPCTVG